MITITVPRYGQPRFKVRDEQEVPTAAHLILYSPQHEILLLRRRGDDYGGHWGMPGGSIEPGEAPLIALLRELREEIGVDLKTIPTAVNRLREGPVSGGSMTFALGCHQFIPILNDEHDDWVWARPSQFPSPVHPNALRVINHFIRGLHHG